MAGTVTILTGIAGTGKTHRCLAEYRDVLRSSLGTGRPAPVLWLTPTDHSRREILTRLPDDTLPVCFSPNVFTFETFTERVLVESGAPVRNLDPAVRRRLLRNLIVTLQEQGRLAHFSGIAETAGFLDLVESFLAELKRDEIWPEQFSAACGQMGDRAKERDLALIYHEYQHRLLEEGLYDAEGQFWAARDVMTRDGLGTFAGRDLIVVDGFSDFTHTQHEILTALAGDARSMIVTLPVEHPPKRKDLCAKSDAALTRLQRELAEQAEVHVESFSADDCRLSPTMAHIAAHLFDDPHSVPKRDDADGLELLAVTGTTSEAEGIAGGVKSLLLQGTEPEDIVLAVRSLDESAALLRECLEAAGIPVWCAAGQRLVESPLLRALLEVIRLELEDWPFERVKAVLRSNYFRPEWFSSGRRVSSGNNTGSGNIEQRVDTLLNFLRNHKLHSGGRLMLKVLRRAVKRQQEAESSSQTNTEPAADEAAGPSDATSRAETSQAETSRAKTSRGKERVPRTLPVSRALELLERLSGALGRLRGTHGFRGWVERLVETARELGIAPKSAKGGSSRAPENLTDERDRQVWERVEHILFDAAAAEELADVLEHRQTLWEFAAALVELLQPQQLPPQDDRRGCVRILEAHQVRNLDVPHLFLAGITEQSFPRSRGDDCLFSEHDRQTLHGLGLPLRHRVQHARDELLLFYSIITRARNTLTLSYPEVGSHGEPLFPSPYVRALRQLLTPDALHPRHVGRLDPLPERSEGDDLLTPADLRCAAVAELRNNRANLFRTVSELPENGDVVRNILAGAAANAARFETRGWTAYEGRLQSRRLKERLEQRFPVDYQFSVTQLENYGGCRFRFFLSDVLGIEPLEPPTVATDYRRRGTLLHDVLAALHRQFSLDDDASPHDVAPHLATAFREHVAERLGRQIADGALAAALTTIEQRLLNDWAEYYSEQWVSYQETFAREWGTPPQPRHLEVPFGEVPSEPSETAYESIAFGRDTETVWLRGRIDRIDIGECGDRPVFNVIDYKSGKSGRFSLEDVQAGKSLQLAVYTLAVIKLGLVDADARPFQMGYWSLRETGFVPGLKQGRKRQTALDEAIVQTLEETLESLLPKLAAGIRAGYFPVDSDDKHCTDRCPYNTVCRITQLRPLQESLGKTRTHEPAGEREKATTAGRDASRGQSPVTIDQ